MIMEPLLGGRLATGLPQAAVSRFKKSNPDISPAAWALKWLWNQPEVTLLLSGMNDIKQLEENIGIADTSMPEMLSEEEIETFRDVKKISSDSFKVHCTGCHYCMPCPFGVNIPVCFTAYNTYNSISKTTGNLQYMMSTVMPGTGYAGLCKKCGKCEAHCPQHIEIGKSLSEVQRTMEKTMFKVSRFGMKIFKGKNKKSK